MDVPAVAIRPLAATEIAALLSVPWSAGLPQKHAQRLALQQDGEATYLIAWNDTEPVGHLLIKWSGPSDEPMRSRFVSCAEIEDFVVAAPLRSRGIGQRMLALAGALARDRRIARLGLAIGLENWRARALYERIGFAAAGCGVFPVRWRYRGADGREHWAEEQCEYLIKDLSG